MLEGRINVNRSVDSLPLRVSEQQLLNCLWTSGGDFDNEGCNGGYTMTVLDEIVENYGGRLPMEQDSPYLGYETACATDLWSS